MEEAVKQLLTQANFAQLGTVTKANKPHVDTVWFLYKDKQLIIATTAATLKAKNLAQNPYAYFVITNEDNAYEQVQIKATLAGTINDDNMAICDSISEKYTGKPFVQRQHKGRIALVFDIEKTKYHIAKV